MTRHGFGAARSATTIDQDVGLIVHSHLRWDFVWQRPQQLLSRMAATNPVLFIEEPIIRADISAPTLDLTPVYRGVTRAVPLIPTAMDRGYDANIAQVRTLVDALIGSPEMAPRFQRVVQWFYTPMPASAMLGAFNEVAVVYDCMDELAQFRFAPGDIGARERQLLSQADVVFVGGHELFKSKKRYHRNVHFFGCGVDAAYFGTARLSETVVPDDAASLTHPVFGYFGVIDERLDYGLIGSLAESRSDATILMIGPLAKVDPRELPSARNIVWLGQRPYADLPRYVKAFDVCLMPFALNPATEYINPTKTLEYMAAGKPIVSTAIADVVRNFSPIVRIARSADEFVRAVSDSALDPDESIIEAGLKRVATASWESIVTRMREIISEAIVCDAASPDDVDANEAGDLADDRTPGWRRRTHTNRASDHTPEAGGAWP